MSNPQTFIFDMDGIIFDTENMFLNCWRKIATDYNLRDIDEIYRRVIGFHGEATKAEFLNFYGSDFEYDKLNQLAINMFFEKAETDGIPVKPGVTDLLEYLKANDYNIGLASSTKTEIVKKQLSDAGLLEYFKVVVGGDMVEKSKPAPDIFLAALAMMEIATQLKISPQDVIAIEDSFNGVRSAYAAGMKVFMVPDIVRADDEIKSMTTKIFTDLFEVKVYVSEGHLISAR